MTKGNVPTRKPDAVKPGPIEMPKLTKVVWSASDNTDNERNTDNRNNPNQALPLYERILRRRNDAFKKPYSPTSKQANMEMSDGNETDLSTATTSSKQSRERHPGKKVDKKATLTSLLQIFNSNGSSELQHCHNKSKHYNKSN